VAELAAVKKMARLWLLCAIVVGRKHRYRQKLSNINKDNINRR
jgi:hypothetical protein